MAKPYLISGIDVGNSQVKVVIAKIERDNLKPEIIGLGSAVSNGMRKGIIVDMEESVKDIKSAIQRAEAMAGVSLKRAYIAVSGLHIKTQTSRGVIAVSRADNEISQSDIDRVLQAASVVNIPANREIIHVIPRNYIVDGTEYIKNPLGMKGVRLEAEVFITDGLSPHLKNLAKCVNESDVEVAGLVFAPLAAALSVLDKGQREYGVMNLDFGGGTSTLTVFEESELVHAAVLPIGSKHITNDLAVALRTSIDIAERIKLEHCSTSDAEDMRRKENLDLSKLIDEENFIVPRKQLIRVVDARAHELFDMVNNELKKVSKISLLPAGIVLSGGGANLPGLALLAKDKLKLPVRIARPNGLAETISDPSYAVSVGLVLWGFDQESNNIKTKSSSFVANNDNFKKFLDWLKNFLP